MCKCEVHSMFRAALLALLLAACSPAADSKPDIRLSNAWARATAPGQQSAAAYVTIANEGGADRLIGVAALGTAGSASLHSSSSAGGVMRMRMSEAVDIPAHGRTVLSPGGLHIMLMSLKQPLRAGQSFRLNLKFERTGERPIAVTVIDASSEGPNA